MTLSRQRSSKIGLPPGTLVHIGKGEAKPARIEVIDYNRDRIEEKGILDPRDVSSLLGTDTVTWIDVCGVNDVETVSSICSQLGVHALVQEDVVNTHQRPKVEFYDGYVYIVIRMLSYDAPSSRLDSEQVSIILGPDYVVTFQEKPGDVFDPVRQRIRSGKGKIRKSGADYLAYALLDVVVDNYFLVIEALEGELEALEEAVLSGASKGLIDDFNSLKRTMITLRRSVWPLREVLASMERCETGLVSADLSPYLRDVYDHSIQVIDTIESLRDVLSGYLDLYLTTVNNRMNEIMKVLTMIATLFIPLTFIAGIYGMNFEHMPELKWPWAYPALLGLMLVICGLMFAVFRKKKWL